ncbi:MULTISPECIES: hypothetical protein [Mycolicibacter]|uniref:Uncharacterized protein n=2 Tax=Mycolicibacter TaxID=1073531 RepID=A0ABU5XKX8_9MYCO|nr:MULTISPECIES: hypothetical protein [unclassified Mycolicibacter]MEB3022935.1 hypothetical protein [Mycolicibacter sp. MYC098]MEB3035078.1 hypothetical protein [Mycolicibacter sp. MYC340]
MRYQVKANELRNYDVVYEVEAGSVEEAHHKAAIGDTVDERDTGRFEVRDRYVDTVELLA